ncbi:FAD/NAD-P-binding domain-containing protein [Laetiporus sulphureus 93-53]|uniref:FAD/NAD-P-binding domain-containing protein n=1 Tax=Laetiporus sulphureus 93-53 TaxID=1314785 RepID=A0A165CPB3_9APHY|nr:FAD/NAD-P-binding domain-containing protein [Laetiporus sulphureus 93-53]KZT03172.1 FAD/NAD-P-binding domain-containing protein [Laetiporus sulphureus 93-53]
MALGLTHDSPRISVDMQDIVERWLRQFATAASSGDVAATMKTFVPNGWLRDALIFTWDTRSLEGHAKITAYLADTLSNAHLSGFKLDERVWVRPQRVLDGAGIGAGFVFETPRARGRGYVHLIEETDEGVEKSQDELSWKALSVFMMLDEIKGHEESGRESGVYGGHTLSWEEVFGARRAKIEADPHVIIVGGGQTGLQIAARFAKMNISAIVVERNKNVGDQWRQRYPTLSLNTPRNHHTFLYQSYPVNWPEFTPKDKLANWLEQYAVSQDLIVWTNSQIASTPRPTYDAASKRWAVTVNRNGNPVELRPRHIVIAIGMLGEARIPTIPGRDAFVGTVLHASRYGGGQPYAGKHAIVVGAGNTAADLCQDLAFHGAQVTMIQRSSTCVRSITAVEEEMNRAYPSDVPLEVSDFKLAAMPLGLLRIFARQRTAQMWEEEKNLHAKLRKGGVRLNMGTDDSGQFFLRAERAGGYWHDVGVADMIESGQVKVKTGVELEQFLEKEVVFTDGTTLPADVVVYATGYIDPRESLKDTFGADVIEQTSLLWGLDEENEIKGSFKRSGYPGLWYGAGDFATGRFLSKQLALQIKAIELGMMD